MDYKMLTELEEQKLDELLTYAPNYSAKNAENIRSIFLQKARQQNSVKKRKPLKRIMLAAAVAAVLFAFTGVAMANADRLSEMAGAIREIVFGSGIAVELPDYVQNRPPDEIFGSSLIMVRNSSSIESWASYITRDVIPQTIVPTYEDARLYASFPIMLPQYLPANAAFGDFVLTWYDDVTAFGVGVGIENILPGSIFSAGLRQTYVGPDAYLWIEQINPYEMSSINIGDNEAFVWDAIMGPSLEGDNIFQREILWISDGIFFTLGLTTTVERWTEYSESDMEKLIAIAESIR